MEKRDLYRLYNSKELADGLKLFLETEPKIQTKQNENELSLSCTMDDANRAENPEICLDATGSRVLKTSCSCNFFARNCYSCAHIRGLLGGYLLKTEGLDYFDGTEEEKLLRKATGVKNPFVPGAVHKSDAGLKGLMSLAKPYSLPVFEKAQTSVLAGEFSIKLFGIWDFDRNRLWVELKAGSNKLYVVKDIAELLNAYEQNDVYAFGKNEVRLSAGLFDAFSNSILEYFLQLYKEYNERKTRQLRSGYYGYTSYSEVLLGGHYSNQDKRFIALHDDSLDGFFDLVADKSFEIDGKPNVFEKDFSYKPSLTIKKREYGAVASFENTLKYLLDGAKYSYYKKDEEKIIRIEKNAGKYLQILTNSFRGKKELFIGESDVVSFCKGVLPQLADSVDIEYKGFSELSLYEPENPKIEIYLDAPSDNMISCLPYAVYEKREQKYPIYDSKADVSLRNAAAEQQAAGLISCFFEAFDEETKTLFLECSEEMMYEFLKFSTEKLAQTGEVFISDKLKRLKIKSIPSVAVGIQVVQSSLEVSLKTDEFTPDELAEILSAYSRKKKFYRLKNGAFVSFEDGANEAWDSIADLYQSHGLKDPTKMRLPLYRAIYLNEQILGRELMAVEADDSYKSLVASISEQGKAAKMPKSLKNVLRSYQVEGFKWLSMLKDCGFGGILADDMGLGKTLQVLCFLLGQKEKKHSADDMRTLIVAPASLIYNWEQEVKAFTPELSCVVVDGSPEERAEFYENYKNSEADIWITSYDLLKRDIALFEGIHFANQIIDEAQYIKNHNTQVAQSVRLIDSGFRVALTGTPIENKLSELWSIFDYLMPGFLYGYTRFRALFEEPIVASNDKAASAKLKAMVHPFILRRLKSDVLKDLPAKVEESVIIKLGDEQKKLYDAHAQRLRLYLSKQSPEEFKKNKLEILAELTKLRQICCDPSLLYENYKGGSAKLEACMVLIQRAVTGGHKVLLFSSYTSMLDIISERLKKEEISFYRIDGSVAKSKRMDMVEAFQTDDTKVFCISLKAGGTGLNLTAADVVIHFDPWWNKAAQNQATDRAHRIGQTQMVNVYQLIANDTIENRIKDIQDSKEMLVEEILSGENIDSIKIDKESLLGMLEE